MGRDEMRKVGVLSKRTSFKPATSMSGMLCKEKKELAEEKRQGRNFRKEEEGKNAEGVRPEGSKGS